MGIFATRAQSIPAGQDREFFMQLCCSLAPAAYSVFRGVLTRGNDVSVRRAADRAAHQIVTLADAIVRRAEKTPGDDGESC